MKSFQTGENHRTLCKTGIKGGCLRKKTGAAIFLLSCFLLLLTGCSRKSPYQPAAVENVTMEICNVSATGATVIIKDTDPKSAYGAWYSIETEKNGQWYEIDPVTDDYEFIEIAYLPNDDGEVKLTVDWTPLYGNLPSGTYRMLKRAGNQYISAEFHI